MNILFSSKSPMPDKVLSNMAYTKLWYKGIMFTSAEQAFQWAKCVTDEDRQKVLSEENPFECRKIGRHVKLLPTWEQDKLAIMAEILVAKFSAPKCKEILLQTGDSPLYHLSPWDLYWGVNEHLNGDNYLGMILHRIRENLRC